MIAEMNGLLQKLNETVVTRLSSPSSSAVSSTFGSVFSTTPNSAAAAAAATVNPAVIYPCSVRPIPFTVPTFPVTFFDQSSGTPEETGANGRTGRGGSAEQTDVDNYRRGDLFANYRGKKYSITLIGSG